MMFLFFVYETSLIMLTISYSLKGTINRHNSESIALALEQSFEVEKYLESSVSWRYAASSTEL